MFQEDRGWWGVLIFNFLYLLTNRFYLEKLAGQEAMLVERLKNKQPILGAMLPLPEVVNLEDSDQESEVHSSNLKPIKSRIMI